MRRQPEVGEQLVALGEELRRAQEQLSGPELRQLATQRAQLVGALVRSARKVAADAGHPVTQAVAYELEQTLHAALADPNVAEEVGAGRLVRAASRTGFDAAAPQPARPVRRLRAVRDDERAEDPAVVRERRLREQRESERAELQEKLDHAEEVRAAAEEALTTAEHELEAAERDRAAAAEGSRSCGSGWPRPRTPSGTRSGMSGRRNGPGRRDAPPGRRGPQGRRPDRPARRLLATRPVVVRASARAAGEFGDMH